MFEPVDERLVPSVRRWQAPRLGGDAGDAASLAEAARRVAFAGDGAANDAGADGLGTDGAGAGGIDAAASAAASEAALQARFEEGRVQGLVEGQAAAHAASYGEAAALVTALVGEHARRDTHLEDELLALARAMARLILRRELVQDADALHALVREALAQLPASTETPVVALHPEDVVAVAALMAPAEAERLVADPTLARGDCRVELGASIVDAGVDAWVSRLASSDGRLEAVDIASPADPPSASAAS